MNNLSKPPFISIVVPARNEGPYIRRALESTARQDYSGRLETIAVDNDSTDDTAGVVAAFAREKGDASVKLLSERTVGVAPTKNTGAAAASGVVLIFLDADSVMSPGLARQVAASHQAGRLAGSIRVLSDGGTRIDRAFFRLMEFGKVRFGIRAQMLYCDRQLFHQLGGFNPRLRLGEDVDFLTRAGNCLKAKALPPVCHVTSAEILTSPRRMAANHHLGMIRMFGRWLLAFVGVARDRTY